MRKMLKQIFTVLFLLLLSFPVSVYGIEDENTFIMPISYMPNSLQPSTASDDYTSMVRPIYDQLFVETKDGLDYYLADSMEVSEDGLTYTIKLNPDAMWSDGEPITVDDILFTFEYGKVRGGGTSSSTSIDGQEVLFNKENDKVLTITLPKVYNTYTTTLARMMPLPAHVFNNDPTKVDDSGYFYSPDMVTSGAYTVENIGEDNIVYAAREDYYRGVPNVKKIIMKNIGTGTTKQVAFDNGEISYYRITTAHELERYKDNNKYNLSSISEARLNYLQLNPYGPNGFTEDQRKAIFLAINPDEILQIAYGSEDLATKANSFLTPDQTLYNSENKEYEYNLEEAKKLSESSNLKGKTLIYVFNKDRANMEQVATVVQQQLAQIGVELQLEGLDSPTFFQRFFAMMFNSGQENTWDIGTNGWDSMRGATLSQAYSYVNSRNTAWGFSDEAAKLAVDVNSSSNIEDAKELAVEFQKKTMDENWIYPLTYTNYVMVSPSYIKGLDEQTVVPEIIDWLKIRIEK